MVRDKRNVVILSHDNLEVVTFLETLVPYIVNSSVPRLAETIERIFVIRILRSETGVFPLLLYPVKSCLLILRIEVSQNHHRKFLHIDLFHLVQKHLQAVLSCLHSLMVEVSIDEDELLSCLLVLETAPKSCTRLGSVPRLGTCIRCLGKIESVPLKEFEHIPVPHHRVRKCSVRPQILLITPDQIIYVFIIRTMSENIVPLILAALLKTYHSRLDVIHHRSNRTLASVPTVFKVVIVVPITDV